MSMYETQRDMSTGGMLSVLDYWWSRRNIDLHTQIPAKVLKIDFIKNAVTVQPLISTWVNNERTLAFKECVDIPVSMISDGTKGGAKITIPLKVGATGLLRFSERDPSNWLISAGDKVVDPITKDNLSMGAEMYPIAFEIGLFTPASAIEWDPVNIVISLGENYILVPPTGGNILINGVQITPTGNVITALGTDLDAFKAEFDAHLHSGVQSGGSNTGGIVAP